MLRGNYSAGVFRGGAAFCAVVLVAWAVQSLTGCVSAHVAQSDVAGSHGEHLTALTCSSSEACAALARKTCKGGFNAVSSKGSQGIGDSISQLIECKPYISNSAIMGPHGETLIEIDCQGSVETCFGFARKTCNGDYDVFMTSPFLIQCAQQSPPPEFPLMQAPPDAG